MKKLYDNKVLSYILDIIMTIVSSAIIALGVTIFISPNRFLSTGFTGVALIIGRIYDNLFPSSQPKETLIAGVLYLIFNIPVLILSWKKLSKRFTILTTINVITMSICLSFFPDNLNEMLNLSVAPKGELSRLDAAIFVGMMNGAANAVSYIFGGSAGGIDILSMYYSVRKQATIGKITTLLNGAILLLGLTVDGTSSAIANAFYTLVYLVINSIVIDLFYTRNRRAILFITTSKGKEVADIITHHFVRGVTSLDAKGAYTGEHKDFLYCACSSFEVVEMIKKIKTIDDHAFVSVLEASKVHGNFLNKELR